MKTIELKVPLGTPVKDVVTGFEGIVFAYTVHITGCDNVAIKERGLNKDGKVADAFWVDVTRVKILGPIDPEIQLILDGKTQQKEIETETGGPQENPRI